MTTDINTMIKRLEDLPAVQSFATRQAMETSLLLIELDARRVAPRDQGRLQGSISSKVVAKGMQLQGEVGPSVRYGAPVEFGRKIGTKMPPVDALIPWVLRHWREPRVGIQRVLPLFEAEVIATNRRQPRRPVTPAQVRRRAWLLARAIQRRGIRRRPYMAEAYSKNRMQILLNFQQVGRQVAASLVGGSVGARTL